ncbi:unnamed protein product [Peniophora sp. CBMAI 1063]|nr:unnamed protein product [Peniophora sp. CBMAI 1063]
MSSSPSDYGGDGELDSDADSWPHEDNRIERFLTEDRLSNLLKTAGPLMNAPLGRGFDRSLFAEGLRFEASLAAAISGVLAVRGEPFFAIPEDSSPRDSVQASLQRFAFSAPDSGHDSLAETFRAGNFTSERIHANYLGPRHIWQQKAADLLRAVLRDDASAAQTIWWRSETLASLFNSSVAVSGRAAHIYLTCAPFQDFNGEQLAEVATAVETALGQIKRLREDLANSRRDLQLHLADREYQLAATYATLYEGPPGSIAEKLDKLMDGLDIPGDRAQIKSLMQAWRD